MIFWSFGEKSFINFFYKYYVFSEKIGNKQQKAHLKDLNY